MVLGSHSGPSINNKNNYICFRNGLPSLFCHFLVDTRTGVGLETACVNDDVLVAALPTLAVMAIAGQSCKIGHDGIATFGKTVKERGLAYIGASDQSQYGFQINLSVGC